MQVLVILSAHEHRIEEHASTAAAPAGFHAWNAELAANMPFQCVWADAMLHAATVSEIVNGYVPPP